MSLASSLTARIMETWAHGQDVFDARSTPHPVTAGVRHVAYLGYRTVGFSFVNRGLEAPTAPIGVVLTAPDGAEWSFGDPSAPDRVAGPALDFALVVTQRRHRDDTALTVTGPVATRWMEIAQAFAGPPGEGRAAGARS
jgi:uncharacterized protein (TIGR03084 family)